MIVIIDGQRVEVPDHRAKELIEQGVAVPEKVTITPDDVIQVSEQ